MKTPVTRRRFVKQSLALGVPALATVTPLASADAAEAGASGARLRAVCVGAHPDDPESGCSGTLALYAARGHEATVV